MGRTKRKGGGGCGWPRSLSLYLQYVLVLCSRLADEKEPKKTLRSHEESNPQPSHTHTHTPYPKNTKITGFHLLNPGYEFGQTPLPEPSELHQAAHGGQFLPPLFRVVLGGGAQREITGFTGMSEEVYGSFQLGHQGLFLPRRKKLRCDDIYCNRGDGAGHVTCEEKTRASGNMWIARRFPSNSCLILVFLSRLVSWGWATIRPTLVVRVQPSLYSNHEANEPTRWYQTRGHKNSSRNCL